ncbi:MAG: redoxin domain-containing protein [Anaerolineales bacterium]
MEPYTTPTRIPRLPDDAIWINLPDPDKLPAIKNRVLLFDIWDYTCINCLRTLPYLREWYARYQQLDFTLIGVHTPEFPFAQNPANVRRAAQSLGIRWPVVLDNDQSIWTAFANRYWPTKYLVDHRGYLRYRHPGEGQYAAFESALQALLQARDESVDLPEIMPSVREEDKPGAFCLPTTPELQADSLGNPSEGNLPGIRHDYILPDSYEQGKFYLQGEWEAIPQGHRLLSETGRIVLNYEAANCNAVLGPNLDTGSSGSAEGNIPVEIQMDGKSLPPQNYGQDVLQNEGYAVLRVDVPRMYSLIVHQSVEQHQLALDLSSPGLNFYAFSFESCASGQKSTQSKAEV